MRLYDKKYILFVCIIMIIPSICYSITHQDVFEKNYESSIIIQHSHFPGPISKEIAKVALARQILEDGPNRHINESIAGISVGGFNKEIVDNYLPKHLSIGYIHDSDGNKFYHFKGNNAYLGSVLVISKLFDYYITKFIKTEKKNWFLAKEVSKAIQQQPDSLH